jgi:hypothetical protein
MNYQNSEDNRLILEAIIIGIIEISFIVYMAWRIYLKSKEL